MPKTESRETGRNIHNSCPKGSRHAGNDHRLCALRIRIMTFHDTSQGRPGASHDKHDIP